MPRRVTMKREEFYFDSRNGSDKIYAVRYTPDEGEIRGVVQIIHGMSEHIGRYEEFARFLTEKGFVVTGDDHLGHGKSVPQRGTYGYFCEQDPATVVVRDVHRLKKLTQAAYPGVPYIILGHSMGSFILRNYLCRYGTGIDGAVIMGTGMQKKSLVVVGKAVAGLQCLFGGSRRESRLLNQLAFGSFGKKLDNSQTESDWLTKEPEMVERYLEDPHCGFVFTANGFRTLFELVSRIQKRENLEKIPADLPIFMLSGKDDPVGEYGAGVRRAYDSLKAVGIKDITLKLYEDDRHELLNETDRETVMQDIDNWMESHIAALSGGQRQNI